MHARLIVRTAEMTGQPYAVVPRDSMWSLVEFLACQRVRVSYSYYPTHFTVTFINVAVDAAQRIVDDWLQAEKVSPPGSSSRADQRLLSHL